MERLKELAADWLRAKAVEAKAVADRVAIEEKIIAVTGKKNEGSQTHDADGFKVTVKAVINRKMDWDKWREVEPQIPAELRPVKLKPELDDKGVRWLQENRPDLYLLLPIETKPGKTGIEIKVAA
jgi:hypothetical protein